MVAPTVAGRPFVVSQIQVLRVIQGYTQSLMTATVIPTDKVRGIFHVRTAGQQTANLLLVFTPNRILRLGITIGRGRPKPRNETQQPVPRGFCVAAKRRLLVNKRHLRGNGSAPFFLGISGMVVPTGFLSENLADITLLCGWRRGKQRTTRNRHKKYQQRRWPDHGVSVTLFTAVAPVFFTYG